LRQNFTPLGLGGPYKRGGERETPTLKRLFCRYWLVCRENGCR